MGFLVISDSTKVLYLDKFINKVFKILPMSEEDGCIPKIYMHSLLIEINSANELFDGELIDILVKINAIYSQNDIEHKQIKKLVFDCTNTLTKMRDRLEG